MKKPYLTLLLLSSICMATPLSAAPLQLFTSVIPIQTFIEKIGGSHVDVEALIRPGEDPHSYQPTPRQIQQLATADLYISVGTSFDQEWKGRIHAANPALRIVDAATGVSPHPHEAHTGAEEEDDPHLWTNPLQVIELANKIRAALSTLDPEHQATYQQNYLTFSAELRALDREIAQLLSHSTAVAFMVQHPVWGNFADRYGVRQIAIEEEGKSPRAKKLVQIIQLAKQSRIKVIFVQPQFSQRAAEQIAREIGARITTVDPLAADYLPNLRHFAQQLSRSD